MNTDALAISRRIIAHHSKSFSLASRLLPPAVRDRAVVVYAWCRRADDAVDLVPAAQAAQALAELRRELAIVYGEGELHDPILAAFRHVTQTCRIPRHYPQELLEGLAMDATGTYYDGMPRLLQYCYRVAGTVGLMMCHVMGIRQEAATANATHLGVAMQITNICRDVDEDWQRGRLYVPADLLKKYGAGHLRPVANAPLPRQAQQPLSMCIAQLLQVADDYYISGDAGMAALSWRSGVAVRTARKVYSAIGERIRRQHCDPLAGRAWVNRSGKVRMAMMVLLQSLPALAAVPTAPALRYPEEIVRAEEVLPLVATLAMDSPGSKHRQASTQQGTVSK